MIRACIYCVHPKEMNDFGQTLLSHDTEVGIRISKMNYLTCMFQKFIHLLRVKCNHKMDEWLRPNSPLREKEARKELFDLYVSTVHAAPQG